MNQTARWLALGLLLSLAACTPALPPAGGPASSVAPSGLLEVGDTRRLVFMVPETEPGARAAMIDAIAADYPIRILDHGAFGSIAMHGVLCEVEPGAPVAEVYAQLAADTRVALVQPLQHFSLQTSGYDDELLAAQENLRAIDLLPAHDVTRGRGVRVAVVDSGIDRRHPDLVGGVSVGRNFVLPTAHAPLGERHGTAVAGVIGARGGNREGIVGVAPEVDLLGLRGCSEAGETATGCSSFALGRALDYALLAGVDVINLSLDGPYDPLLARLIDRALALNTIVVASRSRPQSFPASLPGVVAVTNDALGGDIRVASTAFWAPGDDVLTTVPGAAYDFLSGSSLAAAHVTGLVALLRELDPALQPNEVRTLLRDDLTLAADASAHRPVSACATVRALLEREGDPAANRLTCRQ